MCLGHLHCALIAALEYQHRRCSSKETAEPPGIWGRVFTFVVSTTSHHTATPERYQPIADLTAPKLSPTECVYRASMVSIR